MRSILQFSKLISPIIRPTLKPMLFPSLFSSYIIKSRFSISPCSSYAGQMGEGAQKVIDHYLDIDPENIRTFSIIAHVDHGKSTLADAMMKYSGNILKDAPPQFLDNLEVFYYPFGGLV